MPTRTGMRWSSSTPRRSNRRSPGARRVERAPGAGRSRFRSREGAGRARGARSSVPRRRLRMARARLLDVPGDERRPAGAGRALRIDEQPQLRRPPGCRRSHASGEPRDGGGGRDARPFRRRASHRLKENSHMKKLLFVITAVAVLAGCNTIRGMGEDIKAAGEKIEDATKKK